MFRQTCLVISWCSWLCSYDCLFEMNHPFPSQRLKCASSGCCQSPALHHGLICHAGEWQDPLRLSILSIHGVPKRLTKLSCIYMAVHTCFVLLHHCVASPSACLVLYRWNMVELVHQCSGSVFWTASVNSIRKLLRMCVHICDRLFADRSSLVYTYTRVDPIDNTHTVIYTVYIYIYTIIYTYLSTVYGHIWTYMDTHCILGPLCMHLHKLLASFPEVKRYLLWTETLKPV